MKATLFLFISFVSLSALALDHSKCSRLMNQGIWKTYKYAGIDQPLTKATKDVGTSKATFVMSTESTTVTFDPKYYSNVSTSQTQGTSSFGDCSLLGFENVKKMRDQYFDDHANEILAQIAKGDGEFVKVLSFYSLCDDNAQADYISELKNNFNNILNSSSRTIEIDNIVSKNKELSKSCKAFN